VRIYLKNKPGMVVYTYNPSYWGDTEVRGSQSEASLGKVRMIPYLKNKVKTKGMGVWLKRQSTSLAKVKP
jgi:hypothetical protein